MFCKFCGKQIPDDSIFCSYCGQKLDGSGNLTVEVHDEEKKIEFMYSKGNEDIRRKPNVKALKLWRVPGAILYVDPVEKKMMIHVSKDLSPVLTANDIIDYCISDDEVVIEQTKTKGKARVGLILPTGKGQSISNSKRAVEHDYTLVIKTRFIDHPLYITKVNGMKLANEAEMMIQMIMD